MIVCIESWKGDRYLSGKSRAISELRNQIRETEHLYDREADNLVPLLCRVYGWEIVTVSADTVPDYIYDADTGLIFPQRTK